MANLVFPAGLYPSKWGMRPEGNFLGSQSPLNKRVQTVEHGPGDFWVIQAEFPPMEQERFRAVRAYLNRFRGGMAHRMRIWDLWNEYPSGTLRGSPTLASAAVEGANGVVISGAAGATLKAGDMLGITLSTGFVQLVEVSNPSGTGTITVDITPPLRRSAIAGAAVVWDKPTIDCVFTSMPTPTVIAGSSEGFTFEAVEVPTV